MNINHVVWTRSNWFAEINTGMIIGERKPMRLSFAHKLRLLLENPAVLKSWRIPKELRYFDRKIQQRISFTCSASILHGCTTLSLCLSLCVWEKNAKRRRFMRFTLELTVRQIQVHCASIQMNWKISQIAWRREKHWSAQSECSASKNISVLN